MEQKSKIIIRRFTKFTFLLLLCLQIIFLTAAWSMPADNRPTEEKTMVSKQDIDWLLKNHSNEILAIPGVVGAARGKCNDNPCLKIYVNRESGELRKQLEAIIGGLPFEIEKSGSFQAM